MQSSPFRALAHYKVLPKLVGWPALIIAFVARAPYAMIPLGVMTAVTHSTGSIGLGGLATGLSSIATAIASPLIGRWADIAGQKRVLLLLMPINAAALATMFIATNQGWADWKLWVTCLAVGLTCLPIGSFTRTRWSMNVKNPRELAAAFSYESTADEFVFVLGPALVGIAASAAAPTAPLALAVAMVLVAGLPFAFTAPATPTPTGSEQAQDEARDGRVEPAAARPGISRVLVAVLPAIVIMVCIGSFFGTIQTGVTARATDLGSPDIGGLVYAAMGIGSALMALMVVVIPDSVPMWARVAVGGTGMATFVVAVSQVHALPLTSLLLFFAGLFVGPTMVTAFSASERLAPKGGVQVAMTAMQSSVTIGVSMGSAIGGQLALRDASWPWFASLAVSLVILVTGIAMRQASRARRRADRAADTAASTASAAQAPAPESTRNVTGATAGLAASNTQIESIHG